MVESIGALRILVLSYICWFYLGFVASESIYVNVPSCGYIKATL